MTIRHKTDCFAYKISETTHEPICTALTKLECYYDNKICPFYCTNREKEIRQKRAAERLERVRQKNEASGQNDTKKPGD